MRMTDMEAVKALEPDARSVHFSPGVWLIAYSDDLENPGYANIGPDAETEEEAWTLMRELLETKPTHTRD
jgi:hypothetical protein